MTFRRAAAAVLAGGALLLLPSVARADITAFLGSLRTTTPQSLKGVAVGGTLIVVGLEFEYATAPEDIATSTPGLTTGLVSGVVKTPSSRAQFYVTIGAGLYRETRAAVTTTSTAGAVGGGVIVGLSGPLGVRVDYRVLTLKNSPNPDGGTRQRVYAGLNLKF
ncbi:MAG: hypothetical protein WCP29_10665 [Acidobacteriota bacterium]